MTRILFVTSNLIVGGVEKVCWEIVSNLDHKEYQCDFLVGIDEDCKQYYEEKLKVLGCNIYKGGYIIGSAGKRKFLGREREILREKRYDVVHSHLDMMNASILRVAKQEKVKTRVSHVHLTFPNYDSWSVISKVKHWIQVEAIKTFGTHLLGCSKQACQEHYGKTNRAEVLFNGFDIERFLQLPSVNKNPYKLITIGRICHQKNPEFIIDVMKYLVQKDSRYELYWIGDGDLREKAQAKILDNNLAENVHMIGQTTEIEQYLQKCGVALFPSVYEGLGIAIVETQLAGCYTFYSNVVPDEADVGFGMKLSLGDGSEAWASVIDSTIKNNELASARIDMGKAKRYDVHSMVCRIKEIYGTGR